MAEEGTLTLDEIKKEPEESVSDDFDSMNHSFIDVDEVTSVKDEIVDKEASEIAKSDDDMQGYLINLVNYH